MEKVASRLAVSSPPSRGVPVAAPSLTSGTLPPGPPPLPLVGWRGNAVGFFRNPVAYLTKLRKTYGDVACLVDQDHPTLFTRPTPGQSARTVFGLGPACNKEILGQANVFQNRRPRGPETETNERLANNILFMNGEKHKQQRRLLNPAFTREHLKNYHNDIVHYTEQMLERWQPDQPINLYQEINRLTRSVASKALFGLEPTGDAGVLSITIRHILDAMFSPVTMIPIDLPGTPYRNLRLNMEKAQSLLRAEIERKRASPDQADDVLAMMIGAHDEDGTRLSNVELVSNAFVLFFAGHETATSAINWTLFLLAQHPDVMADLLDELDERLGGAPPTYEQIYDLPVLDRIVKESLRVLSPAIVFPRVAAEATTLGRYEIPAGCEVLYSSYLTHHDPEIYHAADRFVPERWIDFKPSLFEYIPFGAGVRRCLGASFGGMQLRTIIATLVQRYRLEVLRNARIDINVNVVMAPKKMPMIVRRQDRNSHLSKNPVKGFVRQMVELD